METQESLDAINVDSMLWHVGDFGRYQYMLMFLFSVINALSAFHYFGQTFISLVPNFKCQLSNEENATSVTPLQCSKILTFSNETVEIPCNSGWEYNNTYNYVSLVQEVKL